MQTFLPDPNYVRSAKCLDDKRLGKQRLETKQILLALGLEIGPHKPGKKGWQNHPAVRMWRGFELSLIVYGNCVCNEWRRRGFKDTLGDEFIEAYLAAVQPNDAGVFVLATRPSWSGCEEFHASHRSNLLRKDKEFYCKFGWEEPDDLPYIWPV